MMFRIGEEVTVDDAIFSCEILSTFFNALRTNRVSTETRRGFAKALIAFYKFLESKISVGMELLC